MLDQYPERNPLSYAFHGRGGFDFGITLFNFQKKNEYEFILILEFDKRLIIMTSCYEIWMLGQLVSAIKR